MIMKKGNKDKGFELQIIHPTSKDLFQVEWIDVKSPTGDFVICYDHSPLVSIIKDRSKIKYKKIIDQKIEHFDVYGGFIKVEDSKAIIVVDI